MLPMTSPNDPVFFMHHCMVDKMWHEWQLRFPNQGYLPVSGGPFGQNLNEQMSDTPVASIGSRPIDVLDSTAIGISYDQLLPGTPNPEPVTPPPNLGTNLTIDADPTSGQISAGGELDVYRFEVSSFAEYEIETAARCIRKGLIECPVICHQDTLATMKLMDAIRCDMGLSYAFE